MCRYTRTSLQLCCPFVPNTTAAAATTPTAAARINANQVGRLNNLLFLMRFEDEPFPLRLTGRVQYWRRDDKGVIQIREEELKPEQMVLEPRLACPPQP